MPIPASLSKLKSLFPVFVVGASVAITIKLLTESTPLTSEILQVKAEEDIKSVEYKDELVPEPEPEPPQEETPPPLAEEEKDPKTEEQTESKEDSEEKKDSKDSSKEENQEGQKKDQPEQKPKSSGRAFISGGIGDILKQIMKPSKK